jgi:DNA-binding PadR family transcriptional regulator
MPSRRLPHNQARRGDIRLILLAVLAKQPRHGYGIMRHLEEKSHGAWRPSAGVIYPMLQQLEEEELVTGEKKDSKTIYYLTAKGQREVKANTIEGPWESDEEMFRHVAWVKEMASQLTQSYLRMIQVADAKKVEAIRTRTENLLEAIQKETNHDK